MNENEVLDIREKDPETTASLAEVFPRVETLCEQIHEEGFSAKKILAFKLRHVEGLEPAQIKSIVGQSIGWVYKAIHEVEAKLRERW